MSFLSDISGEGLSPCGSCCGASLLTVPGSALRLDPPVCAALESSLSFLQKRLESAPRSKAPRVHVAYLLKFKGRHGAAA